MFGMTPLHVIVYVSYYNLRDVTESVSALFGDGWDRWVSHQNMYSKMDHPL